MSIAIPIQKGHADLFEKSIPELEILAKKEHDALLGIERQAVLSYWRLGEVLSVLREKNHIPHREWMKYVTGLGINYTRAKRALRIRKRHDKPEDCLDKSIDDALAYEQREENDQTTNAPSVPKPVGAKPIMPVHHQPEEQEEEEEIATEESTEEDADEACTPDTSEQQSEPEDYFLDVNIEIQGIPNNDLVKQLFHESFPTATSTTNEQCISMKFECPASMVIRLMDSLGQLVDNTMGKMTLEIVKTKNNG